MRGFHLLSVCSSSQASRIKRLTAYLPISIRPRRYNQGKKETNIGHDEERARAPSTAEEFKRVAEEKSRSRRRQGLASQTVDKALDAAREAATASDDDDSTFESVKEAYKGNLHKTGDE